MSTLVLERNLARFAAARVASAFGSGRGAGVGPLRLVDRDAPTLPEPDWVRVTPTLSGICGSDLATVDGRSSRYFEDLVSFPFVPGHEVVGTVDGPARTADGEPLDAGARVVIEPVLGCAARGIDPPCPGCASGPSGRCERTAHGHLLPGLQIGYCADTGGGWSTAGLVAHHSQLHRAPDGLDDRDAVTVEPAACAMHAVLAAGLSGGEHVAVIGAGSVGLLVTAALRYLGGPGHGGRERPVPGEGGGVGNGTGAGTGLGLGLGSIVVGARYGHQRAWAEELGATAALPPDQLGRAVRRASGSLALGSPSAGPLRLTGGADVVLDCVGSAESIAGALELVRPGGRVVLVGMPGRVQVDLASLWHREVALVGAYTYGTEMVPGSGAGAMGQPADAPTARTRRAKKDRQADDTDRRPGDTEGPPSAVRTFSLAMDLAGTVHTGRLVSALYPLERFEEALAHAGAAGRRRAVKIAFDVQSGSRRSGSRRPTPAGEATPRATTPAPATTPPPAHKEDRGT